MLLCSHLPLPALEDTTGQHRALSSLWLTGVPGDTSWERPFVLLPTTEGVPHSGARPGCWMPQQPLAQGLVGEATSRRWGHGCSKANAGSFTSVYCTCFRTSCCQLRRQHWPKASCHIHVLTGKEQQTIRPRIWNPRCIVSHFSNYGIGIRDTLELNCSIPFS